MLSKNLFILYYFIFFAISLTAQQKEDTSTLDGEAIDTPLIYDSLKPSKTAFYAAILPGLGQIKNKDYWKVPIVWGAIGTGIYFAVENDKEFNRYRDAFKSRLAGRPDEFTVLNDEGEFIEEISDAGLIRAQELLKKNKETAILVTVGLYILQIVEANVDAHLSQFDVEDKLSIAPDVQINKIMQPTYGLRLTYQID